MIVLLLLLLLVSPSFAATTPQYWVHITPDIKQGALFVDQVTHQWYSEWISVGDGGAQWINPNSGKSTGVEHWKPYAGFLMLDYFADSFSTNPKQQRVPANCIKATLQDVGSGQSMDLVCDGHGHYYVPWLLPRDAWRIYEWIDVGYKAFWAAEFTPTQNITNPCYYSGAMTNDAIVQREIWWDERNGWVEGSGGAAYDPLGNPILPMFTWGVQTTVMLGEGVALHQDLLNGGGMCLYSRWLWG